MLGVFVRALLDFYRRQARRHGGPDGHTGTLTVIQRFGGGLNLNVHFHTLVLDGVFSDSATGNAPFNPASPPSDEDVARLLATILVRVRRLLRRRGLDRDDDLIPSDPLAEESIALAAITSASVQGRIALGRRAGARVWRLGHDPEALWITSTGPRQAHLDGFDLHANLCVPATDRARLEQLCRYLLRPPVAQDRLRLTGDGRVRLALKTPWADGTSHLIFEPLEFLEKLAALIPRARVNLVLYHGVLAPHARWRSRVVAFASSEPAAPDALTPSDIPGPERTASSARPRHSTWAHLMRRAFDIDVLACPRCGGRLRLIAAVDDPHVIRQILARLGLPIEVPRPDPPQPPPDEPASFLADVLASIEP